MKPSAKGAPFAVTLATLLVATVASCTPLDAVLGDAGIPNGRSSIVSGEVRSIDSRRGRIEVRDDRGRNQRVHYDGRTRVTYQRRQYPVSQLRRGDYVHMQVVYDRSGALWADRIDVRQSTLARGGTTRIVRLDGTVGAVDSRRGYFALQRTRSSSVVVHVPSRISRDNARRFQRLRRGDRVRVEVRDLNRNQAELVRFR